MYIFHFLGGVAGCEANVPRLAIEEHQSIGASGHRGRWDVGIGRDVALASFRNYSSKIPAKALLRKGKPQTAKGPKGRVSTGRPLLRSAPAVSHAPAAKNHNHNVGRRFHRDPSHIQFNQRCHIRPESSEDVERWR